MVAKRRKIFNKMWRAYRMDRPVPTAEAQNPREICCCYAQEDQPLWRALEKQLMPLKREGLISLWDDTAIDAGADREEEIHRHLHTSHLILMLISPDFLASESCCAQMTLAMKRHHSAEARVIPIIMRPADWQKEPFATLEVLPRGAHPIISSGWRHPDEGFADVARGIRQVVDALAHTAREPERAPAKEKPWLQGGGKQAGGSARRFSRRVVVFSLLALLLLLGGSLLSAAAVGHLPWQPSPELPRSRSSQPGMSATGQLWQSGNLASSGDFSGVSWADAHFVVVGGSCRLFVFLCTGVIFTSPDGLNWTSQHTPTSQHLAGVAWSGTRLVAVGESGTILRSPDGITWTAQDAGITGDLAAVVWSDARFVAVGGSCRLGVFLCSATIFTSPDGLTWTSQPAPTSQRLASVTWSGTRFVAVGKSGTIFTSPDGIAWTSQHAGTAVDLHSVAWSGTRFVIVGDAGTILTSSDGATWTPQHASTTRNLDAVVWANTRFVVVGSGGAVLTSPDGSVWASQNSGTSQDLAALVWSGTRFVTVGVSGVIAHSP
jgi:photosystem II stability/assembly factor-like uncharacterized protein